VREPQLVRPDETVDLRTVQAGDLLFTHGDYWTSRAIRLAQWISEPGLFWQSAPARWDYWNHVAVFCGPPGSGEITEALGKGISHGHVSKYDPRSYAVVRITANDHDRAQMAAFCHHEAMAHRAYGYWTNISIGLTVLTGQKFIFMRNGTSICSGHAAATLTRGDYIWDQAPSHMKPSDLGRYFDVPGPPTRRNAV
jgi:hypothetical protein